MRHVLADVCLAVGVMAVTVGLWRIYPPLALLTFGTLAIAAGLRLYDVF